MTRRLCFHPDGWEDCLDWQREDRATLRRLNRLIEQVVRTPFEGIGKPEPLKGDLSGLWSRRVTGEHRLVYQVRDEAIVILQCRFHY